MAEADGYSAVSALLPATVEPEPLPTGFADGVLAQVSREAAPSGGAIRGSWSRFQIVGYAALFVAAIVLGAGMLDARHDASVSQGLVQELLATDEGLELHGEGPAEAKILPIKAGAAMVIASGFEEPPPGRTYQLWMMEGDECRADYSDPGCHVWSGGLFDTSDGMGLSWYRGSMGNVDRAAVTIERTGGSEQPTGEPVCISG